ncbi:hypothetical protein [Salinimicrobium sp. GXAS 041]|uniref:hypothetical protein n=1 Tax=Salinimicrobium sp. GXAS 041 TaxID=3400806 RepID=UPI003C75B3E6
MLYKMPLLFLLFCSFSYSQTGHNIKDIDTALNRVFSEYKLNIVEKFTDPDSDNILYTINGIGNNAEAFDKYDKTQIEISVFQQGSNKNFTYVVMETIISTPSFSTEKKYKFLNQWSGPPARVHVSWVNENRVNLSITDIIMTTGDSYPRLQDAMISLFGGLYDLKNKLK